MADGPSQIEIRSEDDAWNWLERALKDDPSLNAVNEIVFKGWPNLPVSLDVGNSSITGPMMEAFLSLQEALQRSYSLLKYDTPSINRLTAAEKEALELEVKVRPGSSRYEAMIEEALKTMASAAARKLTGKHYVILLLGAALLYAGHAAWDKYLQNRLEIRRMEVNTDETKDVLDAIKFLSEKETERTKILQEALGSSQKLRDIDDQAEEAKRNLLKQVPESSEVTISGQKIDGFVANELAKNPRNEARTIVFAGHFNILSVDTSSSTGVRVRLLNIENGEEFTAGFRDSLFSEDQINVIQKAEWRRSPFYCEIEATRRGGKMIDATIRKVQAADPTVTGSTDAAPEK